MDGITSSYKVTEKSMPLNPKLGVCLPPFHSAWEVRIKLKTAPAILYQPAVT